MGSDTPFWCWREKGEKKSRIPVWGLLNLMRQILAGKGFLKPCGARLFSLFLLKSRDHPIQMEDSHLRTLAPRILVTAILLVFMGGQDGSAQEPQSNLPTVAVLDFTGLMIGQGGNSAPLGKAVSAMLITELSGREGLQVIERFRLQDLLTEQRLALSGRVDEDTAVEVGQMLGAQYIIHGQVTSIGDITRMDMRAVDVETSEVLEVQKLSDQTSELLSLVVRMADIFSQNLQLTPPSERPAMESIPVQATIEFSRAVDFEDQGDTAQAIEHYRRALEIHPGHRDAQKALDRLTGGGGEDR